jgi:hypothetical protein
MNPPTTTVELLLAFGWADLSQAVRRQVEAAQREPLSYSLWVGMWACGFVATFLLIRMVFTRWGDTRVTQKTLALSLLVHLLAGMISTTVMFDPPLSPARGSEYQTVISRVVIEQDKAEPDRKAELPPIWERMTSLPQASVSRVAKTVAEPPDVEKPAKRAADPDALAHRDLPSLPIQPGLEPVVPESVATPETKPAAVPVPVTIENEATADARPDVEPPSHVVRQARVSAGLAQADLPRPSRTGTSEELNLDIAAPREVAAITTPESSRMTARQAGESNQWIARNGPTPNAPHVRDPGVTKPSEQTQPGRGAPEGSPFSRAGRRLQGDVTGGVSERVRLERSAGTATGIGSDSLAVRSGIPDTLSDGVVLDQIRRDNTGIIEKGLGKVPAAYRLRTSPERSRIAKEMGATDESEQAVAASLEWLARHQHRDGYWPPIESVLGRDPGPEIRINDPLERQRSGMNSESGLTALAVLAFLGANHTHELGPYADNVNRALRWLVAQQQSDGFLGGNANKYARMYCHGMAAIALGEAYGLTKDTKLRAPLERAVDYIVDTQNRRDGSWRYVKDADQFGDMSIFGWQLMALKSAQTAGVEVPPQAIDRCIDYLVDHGNTMRRSRFSQYGGLAAYRKYRDERTSVEQIEAPKPAMTAEALFCRQLLGIKRTNPASVEAVDYLIDNLPRRSEQDLYYWYYGTLAMYHYGGDQWTKWNDAVREQLVADQRTDGDFAGSWNPRRPWGDYGGRVFSTALSTLCLEVYYRFLPLYKTGASVEDRSEK